MAEKRKSIAITTPPGTAVWPKLNEPDFKWKPGGEFSCKLKLDDVVAAPIVEKIEAVAEAAYNDEVERLKAELADASTGTQKANLKARIASLERGSMPFKNDVDDEGEPNGNVIFTFKMAHKITSKKTGKETVLTPRIFDAQGKLIKNPPMIWGGSTLSVAGEMMPYATPKMAGVSLRLNAVQILELVEGAGGNAESYGFGKTDGYVADDGSESKGTDASDDSDGDDPVHF